MPPPPEAPPVRLFARDLGGAGPVATVILHGLLGSSRNWQTAGRDLSRRGPVHALDLRNHGQSPHDPAMDYPAMVGDVLGWLDSRSLGPVELIGHSLGGKVAMLLACRHPERVSRLVVVDIAPKAYAWAAHRAEFTAMRELNLGELRSRAEAEMRMEGRVPDWAMRKFLATNLERTDEGGWRWQVNLPVLASALPDLEANPLSPSDRFPGPVLCVTGGRSAYVEASDHGAIRGHFPLAQIEVLPDSGHNPHIDAREAFVRAVSA